MTRQGACRRALAEWFSVGLLHLERIEWDKSSAGMLEKVPHSPVADVIPSWVKMRLFM